MLRRTLFVVSMALLLGLIDMQNANAIVLDLSYGGAYGSIKGALFYQSDPRSTGTGVIDSFVRIQNKEIEQGYNTRKNNVFDNKSDNTHNHEVLLDNVPVVDLEGVDYYEFLLDINQKNSHPRISLDEIQIFLSRKPNQQTEDFKDNGVLDLEKSTLIYRLDSPNRDNWIKLNADLSTGSGSGDMFMYLPSSWFEEINPKREFVYLYSRFGENKASNGGFEEWGFRATNVIPEPATLSLLGLGLLGILGLRKRTK